MPDRRPPTFDVPDQGDDPVVWDPQARAFVPVNPPAQAQEPMQQRWFVGPESIGKAPPPRREDALVGAPSATSARSLTSAGAPTQAPPAPPRVDPMPAPSPAPPSPPADPRPAPGHRRRRRWPRLRRPKLRWILAFAFLVPLLLMLGGWLYANHVFNQIERVPVGEVLDPIGGDGTNYLIVGSDSRDAVAEAGSDDPAVQPGGDAPDGQRSDTMLLLRIERGRSMTMSIPRDLLVTDAASGNEGRINGAYRDGPANLIRTIQQNLDLRIHRYIEVDFVTFSSLVDALDGITLGPDVVPHPAVDDRSGLNIGAGPVELDGRMALAFVRSRAYTEIIDGQRVTDARGDIGRVERQQAFLRTVLAEAGASRNPLTMLRVASSVSDGLRIDDRMSLVDAVRFAWNMGRLNPESLVMPTVDHRASSGAAVLLLDDELAPATLDQFR